MKLDSQIEPLAQSGKAGFSFFHVAPCVLLAKEPYFRGRTLHPPPQDGMSGSSHLRLPTYHLMVGVGFVEEVERLPA